MPEGVGYPNEAEQARKKRNKKLKAKTKKMRLAAVSYTQLQAHEPLLKSVFRLSF